MSAKRTPEQIEFDRKFAEKILEILEKRPDPVHWKFGANTQQIEIYIKEFDTNIFVDGMNLYLRKPFKWSFGNNHSPKIIEKVKALKARHDKETLAAASRKFLETDVR